MLMARAASRTRAMSPCFTSLSFTATTPCELKPRMWPPAMPAYTDAIAHPAISSASSTARRMEDTVASMLITTPLRRPREGCVPMPMTSIPSGPTSPTMQQIFVVPMSSPTTSSPFFCAMEFPSSAYGRHELRGYPLGPRLAVQIDARRVLAAAGERRPELREPVQLQRQIVRSEAHLLQPGRFPGERGEPSVLLQPRLRKRRPGQTLGAPRLEQAQRRVQPQLRGAAIAQPRVAGEPGHERQIDPVLGPGPLEHAAFVVEQVEAAELHLRGRAVLGDFGQHGPRQAAGEARRDDPRMRFHRPGRGREVDRHQIRPQPQPAAGQQVLLGRVG